MHFLKNTSAVFLSLVAAFLIMIALEFINSTLFPFPPDMDVYDLEVVRAFAQSLPANAFILVLAGWALSSFVGGCMVYKLSSKKSCIPVTLFTVLLVAAGVANFWMLQHPTWVVVLGMLCFVFLPFAGYQTCKNN